MQTTNIQNIETSQKKYHYRLGFDMGASSLGWAITRFYEDENQKLQYDAIIAMGSRIFSDGRTSSKTGGLGESLAASRRAARQARRQIDRKRGRRMALVYALRDIGLMPEAETELGKQQNKNLQKRNPYKLRNDGVLEEITPHELGRAIFHLQKRRGFKSSRKDLQKNSEANAKADESSAVKGTIKKLQAKINEGGFLSVGQYLYQTCYLQSQTPLCKKIFATKKDGSVDESKIEGYENYFDRSMIKAEFDKLWQIQKAFHPHLLTDKNYQKLVEIIFFQRPLKDPAIGPCSYIEGEKRGSMCLPSAELYRIWQDVANFNLKPTVKIKKAKSTKVSKKVVDENSLNNEASAHQKIDINLSLTEKKAIINVLCGLDDDISPNKDFTFSFKYLIKKIAELRGDKDLATEYTFNFDTAKKGDKILGAQTCLQIHQILHAYAPEHTQNLFANLQRLDKLAQLINQEKIALPENLQQELKGIQRLDFEKLEYIFEKAICQEFSEFAFDGEAAQSQDVLEKLCKIQLRDDYTSLSQKAMHALLKHMQQGLNQYDAKQACGYKDHLYQNDKGLAELPYYGEILKSYCVPQSHLLHLLENTHIHAHTKQEIYIGKIGNPSVHIALNELRKVMNALLKKYKKCFAGNNGKPDSIHIELSRDLSMGQKSLDALIKKQNDNEKDNDKLREELRKYGMFATKDMMDKLRYYSLLKNTSGVCIYTGLPLPADFYQVNEGWEIDHILPISRSFDDSRSNKILISRRANQEKGNRTPYEYMLQDHPDELPEFQARVAKLPEWQQWRFGEGATAAMLSNNRDPNARLLSATQYMGKVARLYLQALYDEKDANGKEIRNNCVQAIPSGRLTAQIRNEWNLDALLWTQEQKAVRQRIKAEIDEYQSCQEAGEILPEIAFYHYQFLNIVVKAPMDESLWQTVQAKFDELRMQDGSEKVITETEFKKWSEEFNKLGKKLKNRNDHRHHALDAVALTFADVGFIQRKTRLNKYTQKHTGIRLLETVPAHLHNHIAAKLKQVVVSHKPDHGTQGRLHEESARFKAVVKGVERYIYNKKAYLEDGVVQDPVGKNSVIGIKRKNSDDLPYKYYVTGSNYCIEIHETKTGKHAGICIDTYTANQKAYQSFLKSADYKHKTFEGKDLVLRVRGGDMLKIQTTEGEEKIVYIQKFTQSGNSISICFNEHFETNCSARELAKIKGKALVMKYAGPDSLINIYKAQAVAVTPIGQVLVLAGKKNK